MLPAPTVVRADRLIARIFGNDVNRSRTRKDSSFSQIRNPNGSRPILPAVFAALVEESPYRLGKLGNALYQMKVPLAVGGEIKPASWLLGDNATPTPLRKLGGR